MNKITNALLIILVLFIVCPVAVQAKTDEDGYIVCECSEEDGKCPHRLPATTFDTFEEWEEYYLSHREVGIYWDSYLYRSFANKYRYNIFGERITLWSSKPFYPFSDFETWSNWWDTCLEKEASGEYQYEFINEGNWYYWSVRNRPRKTEQAEAAVYIEPMEGLEETPVWKLKVNQMWNRFCDYLGIK